MSKIRRQLLRQRKQRIERRLKPRNWPAQATPMFKASNVHYELSERDHGLGVGGIGAMQRLVRHVGLIEELLPDQVRRLTSHIADTDIDTGFTVIHRQQLRVAVGVVQQRDVAESGQIV